MSFEVSEWGTPFLAFVIAASVVGFIVLVLIIAAFIWHFVRTVRWEKRTAQRTEARRQLAVSLNEKLRIQRQFTALTTDPNAFGAVYDSPPESPRLATSPNPRADADVESTSYSCMSFSFGGDALGQ